jgi:hypothetical protein
VLRGLCWRVTTLRAACSPRDCLAHPEGAPNDQQVAGSQSPREFPIYQLESCGQRAESPHMAIGQVQFHILHGPSECGRTCGLGREVFRDGRAF